jgi:energy-coupling factor transporter ATP-binding protein EcfA2
MLTRVQLKNFKLHADTSIEAAPITVFIGPNSSGKSSIFQSLLLWRQAASRNSSSLCMGVPRTVPTDGQPYLFPQDQLIDIGEFGQVVRHDEREISLLVQGPIPEGSKIEYGPGPTMGTFEARVLDNRLVYQNGKLEYAIGSMAAKAPYSWRWPGGPLIGQNLIEVSGTGASIAMQPSGSFGLIESTLFNPSMSSPEKNPALQALAARFRESPRKLLESVHPVFPLRGFEEAGYPLADAPAETLDRMALQDRTIALLSVLAYNRDVERRISDWLVNLAKIRIEVKLLPGKRVTILCAPADATGAGSLFSNEGTGANQLPFILVPIGLTPPGETILLSEPEVHLHPRAQAHLTRLFVQLVKKERRQFFIETHSEHVLHALLNSIAKDELGASELAIYYFENENGKAVCTRLQIDETGGVAGGLPGFFDQSLGELGEYLGALKSK